MDLTLVDIVQRLKDSIGETQTRKQSGCKNCAGYRNMLLRNIRNNGTIADYDKVLHSYLKHLSEHYDDG